VLYNKMSKVDREKVDLHQKEQERIAIRNSGIRISLFSICAIIGIFLLYSNLIHHDSFVSSSKIIQLKTDLGMAVLVSFVGSFAALGFGIYRIFVSEKKRTESINDLIKKRSIEAYSSIIVNIISEKKYLRIFLVILVGYALLFSLISQMIIFRPDVSFSRLYDVIIPSWIITPCCNLPGFVPTFTAYLSDNLIIFIIPINLALAVVLSTLVSLNITFALYGFKKGHKRRTRSYFGGAGGGAITGLFTACPICAGTFFSTLVGITLGISGTSAISASMELLSPFQPLFIIISISSLAISSYLIINSIKKDYSFMCSIK
jgi:hypothetical protein